MHRLIPYRHTYTWLDSNRQPTKLPAPQYINLVQKWVVNKLSDTKAFPTDQNTVFSSGSYPSGGLDTPGANTPIPAGPTTLNASLQTLSGRNWVGKMSGFPETHLQDCKNLVRQMFRVYAHIYWNHFVDLYHLKMETSLNSSFTYFIFFVRVYNFPVVLEQ
jgi:Mob1/phocein family